jgi:hypothetical protein
MNKNDFQLLQPVEYRGTTGYISFISEYYISICFIDIPLPESANSRWGRHYVNFIVYPPNWNEIRCRLDQEQEEKEYIPPRSDLLQFGRRRFMGTAHKQNSTC